MATNLLAKRPMRCLKPWGRKPDGIVIVDVGPTVRAADRSQVACWRLNRTAAAAWLMCDGNHTVAEIARALAARHGQELEQVTADVAELLVGLGQGGLVVLDYEPLL